MNNKLKQYIRKQVLKEIGEGGAKPYNYVLDDKKTSGYGRYGTLYVYSFELDDNPGYKGYINIFATPNYDGHITISFDVSSTEQQRTITMDTTNLGLKTMFRIMATIGEAIKDVAKRADHPIKRIGFEATDSKGGKYDDPKGKTQRSNLYDAFIRRNFDVDKKEEMYGEYVYYLKKPIQ
jgi:hypothetical protein